MARPYDLFVQFLVTRGLTSAGEVNTELASLSLAPISQKEYEAQVDYVEANVPRGIMAQIASERYSIDFLKWMRHLGLEELWLAEPRYAKDNPKAPKLIKLTRDIRQDGQLRTAIHGLAMKNVPVIDMVPLLTARFSPVQRDPHITLYIKYFFDPARMTRADWKSYLSNPLITEFEKSICFTALTEELDDVKTDLELPSQVRTSEMLSYLLSQSYRKAKQLMRTNSPQAGSEARAWTDQVLKLVDKYEKYRTSDSTDFAKTLQMQFEFVDTEFPTPDPTTLGDLNDQIKGRELEQKAEDKKAE